MACALYVKDENGFPPISSGANGWADLLQPYAKDWSIFQCPSGNKAADWRRSDYFYNAHLAGISKLASPQQTILFGEGYDNSGTNAHLLELPFDWKSDEQPVSQRHSNGANYAFSDGHIQWVRARNISTRLSYKSSQGMAFVVK